MYLTLTQVEINGERQFMGVIRDPIEEKDSGKLLEQAQRMEDVGRLTGGIAHDFNNLLTETIGNIELLEMRPDDLNHDAILAEAVEAANLGAALVARLLLFSKEQTHAPAKLDLNRAVEDFRPLLQRALGAQIRIRTEPAADLDLVKADQAQVSNARDAMPREGDLTIRTQNVAMSEVNATVALGPGNHVMLSVSDTGSGMAPEVIEHLFEPFFNTKESGKVTRFSLYLPAIKAQGVRPHRAAA